MANWLDFGKQKPGENKDDKVLEITPESINKSITENKTELEGKLKDLGESINNHPTLKAMQDFLEEQKTAREAAIARQRQKQQEDENKNFEGMDQTTREYVDQTLRPIAQATLMQQGNEMRRNIFDDAEAFPYYTGTLKSKIDALLDAQPLEQRANPEIIRNVYKIVIYDNEKEIKEDKHKSRLSSASAAGTGTGMPGSGDKTAMPVLTDQMKSVAKAMGMSPEDYATSMKELQEAGEYA